MSLCVRRSMLVFFLLFSSALFAQAIDGPLSPEDSLKYLKTEPGLKVELVAAEPMVVDPVAVAWDEKGRMYVVEDRGYPTGPGKGKPPFGKVRPSAKTVRLSYLPSPSVSSSRTTWPTGGLPLPGPAKANHQIGRAH